MGKYHYIIQGWRNGSSVLARETSTKKEANRIANKMIACHCGKEVDAVDVCEYNDELMLHSKTTFTLIMTSPHVGYWKKDYKYVGEDD